MEAYKSGFYDSQFFYQPIMAKKTLYGLDGMYSDLNSSVSTAVDEDKQSLLNAVIENFSSNIKDDGDFSDLRNAYHPTDYKIGISENTYPVDPLVDLYVPDSFKPHGNVYQKQQSFSWSPSAPSTSCFGNGQAQLYEKLFDSYIDQFNVGRSLSGKANYLDLTADAVVNALGPDNGDTLQAVDALDKLTITGKTQNHKSNNGRSKSENQNAVDKGKSVWRRKRGMFKNSEKRPLVQLTGQDFEDAMNHLKDVLESLYRDQIPPTFFNVRSRFVEFDTKNIQVEHIMNICQRRQDIFKVETNEALNQTYIYFVTPPDYFEKWIDRNDLTDIYPESMWDQFLDLLVELVSNPEQMMPVFPGSIYGTAKVFQKLELPFFEGMTLGTLCHIVQLAVRVRKLLMYELKTLKPNLVSILQACVNRSK
ncbi:hypothetical protein X943_002956 [Babesia divergens]|uniref:OST-HTH associated domain-containing protein n=1 Tax=Babesia divergens TaxID=32595 RepID=A0AAD9G932_BABDI|nr:hypothetical protein X943_002956 [Babesia divergens]